MYSIADIAGALETRVSSSFSLVRRSSAVTNEQLAKECVALPRDALPGVVIVMDSASYTNGGNTREIALGLVVVAPFAAGMESRSVAAWNAVESLLALFPATGSRLELGGDFVSVVPARFNALMVDKDLTGYALELTIIQDTGD